MFLCTTLFSGNSFGAKGWKTILSGLERCSQLETIDDLPWMDMQQGRLQTINLQGQYGSQGNVGGKEPGVAMACLKYLVHSSSCLTSLDIRFVCSTSALIGFLFVICGNDLMAAAMRWLQLSITL